MDKKKHILVKVIIERQYAIPQGILDWKSWFKDYPMSSHHAAREAYKIGGSDKLVKIVSARKVEL